MEPETLATPWYLLVSGTAVLVLGAALFARPIWLHGLLSAQGSVAPTPRERRWIPLCLIFSGTGWLFVFWSEVHTFSNNVRPYLVVAASLAWFPLAALVLIAVLLWVALVRRFT